MTPTERFSNRVEAYVRYRPTYPAAVLDILRDRTGFTPAAIVADIGSGTGLSSVLFLANGNTVFGVEPNPEMRAAAERILANEPRFHSITGTAEATTLANASVDYAVAGQAFHWFDRIATKTEFHRILKPGGWIVLLWNTRRVDTPAGAAYETILRDFGTDYTQTRHENIAPADFEPFFAPGGYEKHLVPNEQRFDREGLIGRLLSVSYLPAPGSPRHEEMLAVAHRIFSEHESGGVVPFAYNTELYIGRVPSQGLP